MATSENPPDSLPTNWGRWGENDEKGTLHHITAAARLRGVTEAREGRVVPLGRPVSPVLLSGGGPTAHGSAAMPSPVLQVVNTGVPAKAVTDVLVLNTHHVGMTHIDAVAHIPFDGHVYPGVPLAEAVAGGTVRHGGTGAFTDGILTRGVLLDLAPGDRLSPGHQVTGRDLTDAETRAGVRVEPGDALVVRAGWSQLNDPSGSLPAVSLDAVAWMAEREVGLYAGDIGDRPPAPGTPLPLHQVALARLGMPIIDCAEVTDLADTCRRLGRFSFLFVAAVPAIQGASGLPVNPLAVF
ncbi:cyclase family protein [Streptomyces cinereospinus]|uniref:Cyclase family protein n=1 Tax=Streptomyces cinereospinus TaxID=285561 RepID=A0ABV5N6H5_9ACTN